MTTIIRTAATRDIDLITDLIRKAFATVAADLDLTPENAPTHPSNCTPEWVRTAMNKGIPYYILEYDDQPVGCVALERANQDVCYLERLAVLPECRHKGLGRALVRHAMKRTLAVGASRLEIAAIGEQDDLLFWYEQFGFMINRRKQFDHLPFEVVFMGMNLAGDEQH